jgi:hypothetical protein
MDQGVRPRSRTRRNFSVVSKDNGGGDKKPLDDTTTTTTNSSIATSEDETNNVKEKRAPICKGEEDLKTDEHDEKSKGKSNNKDNEPRSDNDHLTPAKKISSISSIPLPSRKNP